MNRTLLFFLILTCLILPNPVSAQVTDATVCDILANPQSFDGQIVRFTGVVIAGFDEFAIKGAGCRKNVDAIWLSYPEGTKGKAGPAGILRLQLAKNNPAAMDSANRVPVKLDKNKDFKNFDNLLSSQVNANGLCLGCVKYSVTATLVGRLDGAKDAGLIRDTGGKVVGVSGFGNLNLYSARLVLQSVSSVSPQEIDYSSGGTPSAADLSTATGIFTPGSPSADQVKRGADAFGAPGENNGVSVGFGGTNELPKVDSAKSSEDSPDGIVFSVLLDGDRLKDSAMELAISHIGTHIADLRSKTGAISTLPLYGAEFRAWQTSVLNAIAVKAKNLTLPGGYVIYSQTWPNADLGKNANSGIARFLANWSSIVNPIKQ